MGRWPGPSCLPRSQMTYQEKQEDNNVHIAMFAPPLLPARKDLPSDEEMLAAWNAGCEPDPKAKSAWGDNREPTKCNFLERFPLLKEYGRQHDRPDGPEIRIETRKKRCRPKQRGGPGKKRAPTPSCQDTSQSQLNADQVSRAITRTATSSNGEQTKNDAVRKRDGGKKRGTKSLRITDLEACFVKEGNDRHEDSRGGIRLEDLFEREEPDKAAKKVDRTVIVEGSVVNIENERGQTTAMKEVVRLLNGCVITLPFAFRSEPKRTSLDHHKGSFNSWQGFTSSPGSIVEGEPDVPDTQIGQLDNSRRIFEWLRGIPDQYEGSTWAARGFLGLAPEIRNKIYGYVIDLSLEQHLPKYEIVTPKIRHPMYTKPFDFAFVQDDMIRAAHRGEIDYKLTHEVIDGMVAELNKQRLADGLDQEWIADKKSLSSFQHLRYDPTWKDYDAMTKDEAERAPRWLQNYQLRHYLQKHRHYWNEFLRPLLSTVDAVKYRRELSKIKNPAARLIRMDKAGDVRGIASLGLTCRTLSKEYLSLLYSRVELCFGNFPAANLFFSRLRPSMGGAITHISLYHRRSVENQTPDEQCVSDEIERKFGVACRLLARSLPNLERLDALVDYCQAMHVHGGYIYPYLPPVTWTEYWEVKTMEGAAWFQPLKAFRRCKKLREAAVLYQLDPRRYDCYLHFNPGISAAFGRLLILGPDKLLEEYDSGSCDWFLSRCNKATTQRYPVEGPLNYDDHLESLKPKPKPPPPPPPHRPWTIADVDNFHRNESR